MRPAWSWQFEAGRLAAAPALELPSPITAEWAWGASRAAGVRVAVIDSGIDPAHPAVGRVAGGVALHYDPDAPDQVRAVEGPHEDLFGHGTACAGIIRSLAPEAELYSVRVLGSRLTGKGVVFAAGLRWAIDHRMQVVNLSLSTGRREHFATFHELVDEAYFANVMLVCAVNNVAGPSYPSQYASVFSVAANDASDPSQFDYNPAPPVEFGAPGIDVQVPWLGGSTISATGNSFAAPRIAGHVARILGEHPGLTPFQVKTVLLALASNTARPGGSHGDRHILPR
jgi:subtilisin family serine protease